MIHGIGTDIAAVERLRGLYQRHGDAALEKLLAPEEIPDFRRAPDPGRFLAKRFAAKEAFAKAYGTGLRGAVVLPNLSVVHDELGRPFFAYAAALAALMSTQGLRAHLSISDEKEYALAFVVLEKE